MHIVFSGYKVRCMYTYETATAMTQIRIEDVPEAYDYIRRLVERHFKKGEMDNKITIEFEGRHDPEKKLYMTYWDSAISISSEVRFLVDLSLAHNSYRIVYPNK